MSSPLRSRAAHDRASTLSGLVDLLLRWRIEGLDRPVTEALGHVAGHLRRPDAAHPLDWQTLRFLLDQVFAATLRIPETPQGLESAGWPPAADRYRTLSRACAAGLPLPGHLVADAREVARDACVLLHTGEYLRAARALTVLAGVAGRGDGGSAAGRILDRFVDQARDHLAVLAVAFRSPGLSWELRLLAQAGGVGGRQVGGVGGRPVGGVGGRQAGFVLP